MSTTAILISMRNCYLMLFVLMQSATMCRCNTISMQNRTATARNVLFTACDMVCALIHVQQVELAHLLDHTSYTGIGYTCGRNICVVSTAAVCCESASIDLRTSYQTCSQPYTTCTAAAVAAAGYCCT
eukprot:12921-Heterococcus_DN1.PRE.1